MNTTPAQFAAPATPPQAVRPRRGLATWAGDARAFPAFSAGQVGPAAKRAGVFIVCLLAMFALPSPARAQAPSDSPTPTASIRIAGPLVAKGMMEELVAEYDKSGKGDKAVDVNYLRIDVAGYAASALVGGRDMVLTFGKITDKDLALARSAWKRLAPAEHPLGARAVAVVVHERNSVESLTMEQLQKVFAGQVAEWSVIGGERKPIRRYGLGPADALMVLFHDKVLAVGRCGAMTRKANSAEVLTALAGDSQGIAVVDAVEALAAGGTVKIVGIGDPGGAGTALPNAQTIKDGTYPLARALMLYVSPKASRAAEEFAQFILAGKGDAVCRRFGFMPMLRSVRADAVAAFEKLYGGEIKRVKGTADPNDDITLAEQILNSARTGKLNGDLLITMCESAYDLAFNASSGEPVAFDALSVLGALAPEMRCDCAFRQAALYERAWQADKLPGDGERLIEALMAAGDLGTSAHRFAEAAEAWAKALAAAEQVNSPKLESIQQRQPAFAARAETVRQLGELAWQLRDNPQDAALRNRMLNTYLMELDNPAEAAKLLDAGDDETLKTNIPLAAELVEKLSEEAALMLGEWYAGLSDKAGLGGKELMAARARSCYSRFFDLHADRADALAMRATLGMQKVGGQVPDPPTPVIAGKPKPKPSAPARQPPGETTAMSLAEYVSARPTATRLSRQEIGSATYVTDLRALPRLSKLTSLELSSAAQVKDLSPVGKLTGLTSLTLTGLEVDNISALSNLPHLTTLDLSKSKNIRDLSPMGRLAKLKTLNLSGCTSVSDITPLGQLQALTSLNLSGCSQVNDLRPLEKLAPTLTTLNLNGCTTVTNVTSLPKLTKLKTLDLRNCGVSNDDLAWLGKHMPDCKISPKPPQTP